MVSILIVYYSSYGHVEQMAYAEAEGTERVSGVRTVVKRVRELVPAELAKASGFQLDQKAPFAEPGELEQYDAVIFGTPTRFGNMAAQMRNFLDQTGALWTKGALVGKIGSVFCSTASQHGGQETTITSFHSTLLHHGMVIVGTPYTYKDLTSLREVCGGSPYGASCITGVDAEYRMPTQMELGICRFQGEHVARIASRFVAGAK